MTDDKDKKRNAGIVFVVAVFGIILLIGGILFGSVQKSDNAEHTLEEFESGDEAANEAEDGKIVVYITGEVKNPDVYTMQSGDRLNDLIEKAGGLTDKANIDELNLAKKLEDGEKIVINNCDNKVDKTDDLTDNKQGDFVNINTADVEELKTLPGIGDGLAQAIVDYRQECGNFTSLDELKEVDGLGESIFNKIKDKITY